MNTLKTLATVMVLALFFNCGEETTNTVLEGYFVTNNVVFKSNVETLTFSNKADFDSYFGLAKTMKNTISEIDFNTHNVAAIIAKPSNQHEIDLISFEGDAKTFTIQYDLKTIEKTSHLSSDLKLLKIAKTIQNVTFVTGDKKEVVEIK